MSRKSSSKPSSSGGSGSGPPPSVPQDNDPSHRLFLLRSLDRCDVELAALCELNKSLHESKDAIIKQCDNGEQTLLHIGQGLIKLTNEDNIDTLKIVSPRNNNKQQRSNNDNTEVVLPQDKESIKTCIDFILRMKLRRKLCNRLARRLNRLSHAIDGQDIAAPIPPKYGDLRLHVDSASVQIYAKHWKLQDELKNRLKLQKDELIIKHQQAAAEAKAIDKEIETKKEEDEQENNNDNDKQIKDEDGGEVKNNDKTDDVKNESRDETTAKKEEDSISKGGDNDQPMDTATTATDGGGDVEKKENETTTGGGGGGALGGLLDAYSSSTNTSDNEEEENTAKCEEGGTNEKDNGGDKTAEDDKPNEGEPTITPDTTIKKEEGNKMDESDVEKKAADASKDASTVGQKEAPTKDSTNDEETKKDEHTNQEDEVVSSSSRNNEQEEQDDDEEEDEYKRTLMEYHNSIKDYNDAYEKEVNMTTGQIKYTTLDQDYEEDHASIKYGAGIGATHRSMSSKEKEAEFKRWQHSILSRIPDQPTFNELGLNNRVFMLDKRLEQIQQQQKEKEEEEQKKKQKIRLSSPSKGKVLRKRSIVDDDDDDTGKMDLNDSDKDSKDDDDDDDEEMEDVNEHADGDNDEDYEDDEKKSTKSPSKTKKSGEDDDAMTSPSKNNKSPDGKKSSSKSPEKKKETEEDKEKKRIKLKELDKKRKRMQVVAVPSFYEQDMKRIRYIHQDLIQNDVADHGRRNIAAATNAYNNALRQSNNAFSQKTQLQANLNTIIYENRVKINKVKNEYSVQVAYAKARWLKRKDAWDQQKMQTLMPMNRGQPALGTILTGQAIARNDPVLSIVATTMANLVDAVETLAQAGEDMGPFEDFVPPQAPSLVDPTTGESLQGQTERVEAQLRLDLSTLAQQLIQAEDDRRRAWKKLLKTRSEFGDGTKRGRGQYDYNQMQPMPQLRATGAAAVLPAQFTYTQPSLSSYRPPVPSSARLMQAAASAAPNRPSSHHPQPSESKYSVAKVRERIKGDGTVRPVTMPKQNKDGTYQRPAGRTRKGMDWDAVRGLWVPQANYH